MNIIACLKQVPASNETRLDPVTHTILREGAENILNPFDAHALEAAVQLKARLGGRVTALSMGIPGAERMLRRALAVGADRAVLLTDRAFAGADTLATARTLAAAIAKLGPWDLIVCGNMATDGDTAQVGPMLAALLNCPQVTCVSDIEAPSAEGLIVSRRLDERTERLFCPFPSVVCVLRDANVPRLPSMAGILRAQQMAVERWGAAQVGLPAERTGLRGSNTKVVSTARPAPRGAARRFQGSADDQVSRLISALQEARLLERTQR